MADAPGALTRRVISRSQSLFDKAGERAQHGKAKAVLGGSREKVHELQPTKVFGGIYSTGDLTYTWAKVLATLECNI